MMYWRMSPTLASGYVTSCQKQGRRMERSTHRNLQLLLAGLQRHLRKIHPDKEINLFSDPRFQPL